MGNILVLIPIKVGIPHALDLRCEALLKALVAREREIGEHQIEAHAAVCLDAGDGRPYSAHAAARNGMLDLYLKPEHTHVLWIDADVVDYPADLATRLHSLDSEGIIAPLPLIEGSAYFYDRLGFVDTNGHRAQYIAPYFDDPAALIPMHAVGTCYLAPAALYRAGARYEPTEGETEHWSVCRQAARVSAARSITVSHADLTKWGEAWHE